jgi:CBS domain-containing protein
MDSSLLKLAQPPASVSNHATVFDAVRAMLHDHAGAALVLEDGRAVGVLTEHDALERTVAAHRDPSAVAIESVMTSPVVVIGADMSVDEALDLMVERHIRHLPVVDADQRVLGMLSLQPVMRWEIDALRDEARSLASYMATEGIAGG